MLRPEEAQRPYTVTELANEIRRELRPLTALLVKGEVSGMKRGAKGRACEKRARLSLDPELRAKILRAAEAWRELGWKERHR